MDQDQQIERPQTPPYQPNAGVTMSRDEMETIVKSGFPQSKLISVSAVPTSDSFNNRIYFLGLLHTDETKQDVALKINGRFFGASKVQNEVACLQQLEKHCPQIPSPRVLAWSDDGQMVSFTTAHKTGQVNIGASHQLHGHSHGGWILTTKVPGTTVSVSDLNDESCRVLGRQLADIVSDWRHNIPSQPRCGNIKLPPQDESKEMEGKATKDSLIIQGIVMDNFEPPEPVQTVNTYQKLRLGEKMRELATTDTYAPNRHLLPILQKFIDNDLPKMKLAMPPAVYQSGGTFVFTHYDLAPRNVLVSGQPPTITGMVDFEFAGFFHPMEEFLNDCIDNRADWPATLYTAYQERLEEKGIATPIGSMDQEIWNRNYWLEMVVNYVAPWWLPGRHKAEGLADQLKKAETVVLNGLANASRERGELTSVPAYGDLTRD